MKDRETTNMKEKRHLRIPIKRLGVMIGLSILGLGAVSQQSLPKQEAVQEAQVHIKADQVVIPSVSFEDQLIKVEYRIGGQMFTVQSENGDSVLVEIDGAAVPDDRIHREKGKLVIFDENGNELQTLHLFNKFNREFMFKMMNRDEMLSRSMIFGVADDIEPSWVERFSTFETESSLPSVMLGIFTEETHPALEKHLGLEVNATVTIIGMKERLPAEQSGLEVHDIILSVDGRQPVSKHVIYDVLMEKTEGETLELSIIQAGEPKSIDVTLEAFDRDRMSEAKLIGSYPYRFRRGRRHFHRTPSLALNPVLEGVLVPSDSSQIFRFGPSGFDPGVQAEILTLIRKQGVSEDGESLEDIMEIQLQLQDVREQLEKIRPPGEDSQDLKKK